MEKELVYINHTLQEMLIVFGEDRDIFNQALDELRRIRQALEQLSSAPVGFKVEEKALPPVRIKPEGENMTLSKAAVDLQILDDGKGVLYTLTPVNHAGVAEPLPPGTTVSASSSAPASLAVAPDPGDPNATPPRPPDTTGLVFLGTVPQPPVDAVGVVVTFSAPFGSTAADPVDIAADNSPVGFTITESAL